MKRFAIRALLVSASVIGLTASGALAQVAVNVTIGGFYDELAPYGQWVDCRYGQCWVPARVASDWQPYSNGQWIYTEYGWTWVSNDPWGGSPYHYGTWASIEGYGWSWVPGTVWAPAWVTWSYSNNYVGWAPLPPTVAFGASGYVGSPVVVSQTQYVFVPTNRFVGRNVASVRLPVQQSAEIFRQTQPVTGFAVSGGIVRNTALPMATIERAAGGKVETRSIQVAGTAPRAVSAGTSHLTVVAPAREVKAAVAARPRAVAHSPESSGEPGHTQAPVDREDTTARAPKAHDAASKESHRQRVEQAAQPKPQAVKEKHVEKSTRPPAEAPVAQQQAQPRQPSKPRPEAGKEKSVEKSHSQTAGPPAAQHQDSPGQAEAHRPAQHAPKATPHAGKEKSVEKDKKPDGEKP